MQLGVHFANFTLPGGNRSLTKLLGDTARASEEVGATMFTLMDHYFQMEMLSSALDPCLEGYTSLGYLAGQTEKMELGLLVTGVSYRHPGLLAKIVTTLDVLSGGRAFLGIGAAWYEREHLGLGVPFPPLADRFEMLEETLQIVRQMWSDNDGPYDGKHYQLAETINHPEPIQHPSPKILIGGSGERKTLRMVAQYGDACNIFSGDPEVIAHKLDVLARHCDDLGRDYSTIDKTVFGGDPFADPDGFLALAEAVARLDVSVMGAMPLSSDPVAEVRALGDRVVPRLTEIG